jgi:hypothetical protein
MTPDPYLRNFAVALGLVLFATGSLGMHGVAVAGTGLNLAVWGALRMPYRQARRRWSIVDAYTPAELADAAGAAMPSVAARVRLDRLVDRSAIAATAAGVLGLAVGLAAGTDAPGQLAGHAAGAALVVGAGGIFWSSLVDWYWVLPRISGLTGHRACRLDPEPGADRISWEEVTRWWIIHRIAAVVAVAVAAGGLVGTVAGLGARSLDAAPAVQGMVAVLSAIVATFAEVYRKKAAHGLPLLLHPEIVVGESYLDAIGGPCFPVDVAMEGFKIVKQDAQYERYLAHRTQGTTKWLKSKGDETVPLADAQARRAKAADVRCRECIGLNWYCVNNPNAWDKGPKGPATPQPVASPSEAATSTQRAQGAV